MSPECASLNGALRHFVPPASGLARYGCLAGGAEETAFSALPSCQSCLMLEPVTSQVQSSWRMNAILQPDEHHWIYRQDEIAGNLCYKSLIQCCASSYAAAAKQPYLANPDAGGTECRRAPLREGSQRNSGQQLNTAASLMPTAAKNARQQQQQTVTVNPALTPLRTSHKVDMRMYADLAACGTSLEIGCSSSSNHSHEQVGNMGQSTAQLRAGRSMPSPNEPVTYGPSPHSVSSR